MGTPSSGVRPIVVSRERPSRTAVTEQPPPRWQTTSRGAEICSTTDSTASPWKPRRTISGHGTAYRRASSVIPAWNHESETTT